MIALMLARPRPPLPAGTDAVEVVPPEVGGKSSALSFKCRWAPLVNLVQHERRGSHKPRLRTSFLSLRMVFGARHWLSEVKAASMWT